MSTTHQQAGIEALDVVSVVVPDQDAARTFYSDVLGFEVRMDESFEIAGAPGRWLTVGVPGQAVEIALIDPEAAFRDDETRAFLTGQQGIRTWFTFRTGDCEAAVETLEAAGVEITAEPTSYPWGTEAMFADPFGNEFALFAYAEA